MVSAVISRYGETEHFFINKNGIEVNKETFCSTNHWTGFYMITADVRKS